jgi:hypothetical protein
MDRVWDFFVETMMTLFLPLVCSYFVLSANIFLNVSVQDATGLEWLGNQFLSPVQFILAGKEAVEKPEGGWKFVQRFEYQSGFWVKTTASIFSFPPSIVIGSAIKGLSLLDSKTRSRFQSLLAAQKSKKVYPNKDIYHKLNIDFSKSLEKLVPLGCQRRPGDENTLKIEKEALGDIGNALNIAGIAWWLDCGTCLGAYRYGGAIPWDGDIDIAVLLPDFQNVRNALNLLDPKKYLVQDWSTRERPDSYLKVFIRTTGTLIDIYHFEIDFVNRQIQYVFSLESNIFFPEWWKIRERRFKAPVAFETIFPLRKADFDGIEVFVPNNTKKYLQRYYGENLDPVKIYDPKLGRYEKDLSHPYWQTAYVK